MTTKNANAFQALAPRRAPSPAPSKAPAAVIDNVEEDEEARIAREAAEVAELERAIFSGGANLGVGGGGAAGENQKLPEAAAAALMSGDWADTDEEEEQLRQVRFFLLGEHQAGLDEEKQGRGLSFFFCLPAAGDGKRANEEKKRGKKKKKPLARRKINLFQPHLFFCF